MKYLSLFLTGLFLSGCATSQIPYNSAENKYKTNTQIVSNKECVYLVGPFNVTGKITIDEAIKRTIKKANDDGFYGNELINIKIKEGIDTGILASRQCIYIEGNLIFQKKINY